MSKEISRREFIKGGLTVLAGLATIGCGKPNENSPTVNPKSVSNESTRILTETATPAQIPLEAIQLKGGEEAIPVWGHGPFGAPGVEYPKVLPKGEVKPGSWQLVTDFDGQNWKPEGRFEYLVASGVTEIWATTQGDAPVKVLWNEEEGMLTFWTNKEVTSEAPSSWNNQVPKPSAGSTGTSLVIWAK